MLPVGTHSSHGTGRGWGGGGGGGGVQGLGARVNGRRVLVERVHSKLYTIEVCGCLLPSRAADCNNNGEVVDQA